MDNHGLSNKEITGNDKSSCINYGQSRNGTSRNYEYDPTEKIRKRYAGSADVLALTFMK